MTDPQHTDYTKARHTRGGYVVRNLCLTTFFKECVHTTAISGEVELFRQQEPVFERRQWCPETGRLFFCAGFNSRLDLVL